MKKIKCIICGRDLDINKKKEVICDVCKSKIGKYKKEKIHITFCRLCFRYKIGKKWNTPQEQYDNLKEYVSHILNIPLENIEEIKGNSYRCVDSKNKVIKEIQIGFGTCDECSRMFGGYYECIVQIRGDNAFIRKMEEKLTTFVEKSNMPRAFITKIERVRGGKDIYLGSKKIGKKFIKTLDKKQYILKMSTSFYGVKDGKRITRDVFLIRQREGDMIGRKGKD